MIFSDKDVKQIKNHGLSLDEVNTQIENFNTGFPFLDIVKPAVAGDGVIKCSPLDCERYIDTYEKYALSHKIMKFVPASGAATRMFKDLFDFIATNVPNTVSRMTANNITRFAFWDDLKQYLPQNASDMNVAECLVTDSGLNYGNYPKGLIKFHKYPSHTRTPIEEHLDEGAQYAMSGRSVNIHFTISPEYRLGFEELINRLIPQYESKYGVKYNVSLSEQKSSTDTIALQMDKKPFRNPDGSLLFRPAGHGALIENLNEIDADLVFIKNIDNITIESLRDDTIKYKKILAGMLVDIQKQIFDFVSYIDSGINVDTDRIHNFIVNNIGIKLKNKLSLGEYRDILNRPLRVCGMVKNTGAPGGGPFWVRENNDVIGLQIVESSQIAQDSKNLMNTAEYFNPVDLVCGIKDFRNAKFNLTDFVDNKAGFISEKSRNGIALLAMERPGLWNGAMAKWNTIFVEVPADTFTPVKVVTDLLLPPHQPK